MLGDFVRPYKTGGQMKPNPIIHLRFFALTRLRRRFPPAAAAVIGAVTGTGAGGGGGI